MKALEDIDMDEVFDDPSPQGFGSCSDSAGRLASGGRGGMFHQDIGRTVHGNMFPGEGRGGGALDFGPRDGSRPSALRSSGLCEDENGGFRGGGDIFGGNSAGGMRGGSDFGGGWSGDNGGRGQCGGGGFGGGGQFGRMGNDWGSGRSDGVRDFHANVDGGCFQYPEQPPLQLPDAVGEIEPETDKEIARLTNDTCTWGSPADLALATKKFSHAKDVRVINREVFKNKGFRTHQEEVINAALSGKDVFVLMPTGGGKSLCYQICAMIQPGITVVISPLVSLMQDQVYNLRLLRVPAICLNGNSTQEEVNKAYRCFQMTSKEETPAAQLIYITPEKYSKSGRIRSEMKRCRQNGFLNRVVIDEAHCVSEWGHDFRPDYKMLGTLKQELNNVPIMALTATATKRVRQDIRKILGIRHSYIFIQSFNRPNLIYEVRQKKKNYQEELVNFIKENYRGETGIVYCLSKHRCEDMAECLNKEGIRAKPYHAGLDDDVRRANQDDWSNDKTHVICATIAFGMGINKPDVRFVVHDSLPKSMEGYYQESGRAGRDGKRSHCILYYTYRDKLTHDKMSEEDYKDKRQRMRGEDLREAEKQRDNLRDQLNSMVAYCESTNDCRRILLMSYFNEDFKGHCGKTCDNCASGKTGSAERRDVTNEAEAYVNIVEHFERLRVTKSIGFFIKLFRGSQAKDAIEYQDVQGYGVGKSMKEADAERLYRLLVQNNILLEKSEHNSGSLFGGTLTSLGVGPKRHLLRSEGLQMAFEALPEKPAGKSRKGKAAKGRGEEVQLPSTVKERKPSTKRRQPIEKIDDSEEEDILVDMTKGRNAPVVLDKPDMTDGLGFKGNKAMTKEQQEDLYEGLRKCREENFKKLRTSYVSLARVPPRTHRRMHAQAQQPSLSPARSSSIGFGATA
jgi:RecQ family ATP-dependent DNA helicase